VVMALPKHRPLTTDEAESPYSTGVPGHSSRPSDLA
jgi:hypothetical protein